MKTLFYLICLLPLIALGQSTNQNYVKSVTYKDGTTTTDLSKANAAITYLDGLGRPVQHIAGKMSGTGTDMVTPVEYDFLGRQSRDYLPYPLATATTSLSYNAGGTNGTFDYYNTAGATVTDPTAIPYSKKFFDTSPLNRVLKHGAPGTAWGGNNGDNNDHTVKFVFLNNVAGEVKMLKAVSSQGTAANSIYDIVTFNDGGFYPAGSLYKTITQDENKTGSIYIGASPAFKNNTVEEFKDGEGKVLLKRTFNGGVAHDTYYVYDQFGNLSFVLPPLADGAVTYLNDLCYQYKYDYRNRLVEKKLPGKQWEYMVYDAMDRVIATGPAISPFGGTTTSNVGWMYNYYDALGRPAYSGWYPATIDSAARNALQSAITGAPYAAVRGTGTIDGIATGYAAPTALTGFKLLSINYYDDYTWPGAGTPATVEGQVVLATVKGLPTGSWERALETAGDNNGETSCIFYDAKGRAVHTKTTNYLGGYNQTDSSLGFDGRVNYTITRHKRLSGDTELMVREDFTYTPQDRLLTTTHTINSLPPERLSANTYNAIGQLTSKQVGGTTVAGSQLQTIDYKYNIRGWLTDINDIGGLGSDLFAFKISYNTAGSDVSSVGPLYNGNISETQWLSAADNVVRKYGYAYDNLNRLTNAYYQKPVANVVVTGSYNENVRYDKNGNITNLTRNGGADDPTTVVQVDQLQYAYPVGSNQLQNVYDASNSTQGFKDYEDSLHQDYTYDDNGNLKTDKNKGITGITYNHLNLPVVITFGSNGSITYLYNAAGAKLKKMVVEVQDGTPVTLEVDYLGGFQYKAGVLQYFPTPEGYVDCTAVLNTINYSYVYQYKDHLGNVRMNFAYRPPAGALPGLTVIKDESHYYPFGLRHMNYNMDYLEYQEVEGDLVLYPPVSTTGKLAYNYKYNGKELQDELGLNMYDYGARNYDPALGRFMNIDPLAEKGRRWSPYTYAMDNPVYFIDPDGMWPWPTWSQVKSFASGFATRAASIGEGAAPHNMIISGVKSSYAIGKSLVSGSFSQAGKQALDHTGVPALIDTAKKAANGDAKAIGSLAADVVAIVVVHKAGGKAAASESAASESTASKAPVTNEIYSRPNNATTPAQRASVQGEPCVDCGATSEPMVADHKTPLVKEHYETGTIDLENMRSTDAVQPQCTTCSAKQGAEMSKYSKEMKAIIKERTGG